MSILCQQDSEAYWVRGSHRCTINIIRNFYLNVALIQLLATRFLCNMNMYECLHEALTIIVVFHICLPACVFLLSIGK